jgi:hypothetical protein
MLSRAPLAAAAATWLVLVSTLAGYMLLINAPGTPDVPGFWMYWISLIRDHGLIRGYALAASDYLPGTFVALAAIRALADAIGLSTFIALKLGIILAAWTGALIYWAWSRNLQSTTALLLALVINSAAHAYLDAFYLPPLLLMFWSLHAGRWFAAGLCLGLALSIKWQPLLIAPFVLVYVFDRRSWQPLGRLLTGVALPLLLQIAIVGVQPLTASFIHATSHNALSFQGLNINWVWQLVRYNTHGYTGAFFNVHAPRLLLRVMKGSFFAAYAATVAALWLRTRRRSADAFADLLWCAFTGSFAYFALNIGVHENHLFVTMVLAFCLLAINTPRAWLACLFCALSFNINLVLFYGLNGRTPVDVAIALPASIIVSLINTAVFGWCLFDVWRPHGDSNPGYRRERAVS